MQFVSFIINCYFKKKQNQLFITFQIEKILTVKILLIQIFIQNIDFHVFVSFSPTVKATTYHGLTSLPIIPIPTIHSLSNIIMEKEYLNIDEDENKRKRLKIEKFQEKMIKKMEMKNKKLKKKIETENKKNG